MKHCFLLAKWCEWYDHLLLCCFLSVLYNKCKTFLKNSLWNNLFAFIIIALHTGIKPTTKNKKCFDEISYICYWCICPSNQKNIFPLQFPLSCIGITPWTLIRTDLLIVLFHFQKAGMDKVLFLIYGVTYVIGISMPLVILWVYRTILKFR